MKILRVFLCLPIILAFSSLTHADPARPGPGQGAPSGFSFDAVVRRAADLAATGYAPDRPELPKYLADLDYDGFRDIRFKPAQTLWLNDGLPFRMQFFPRGFLFKDRVTVNVVDGGRAAPVAFRRDFFDYGKNAVPESMPTDLGFAGLRLMHPINKDSVFDEVAVFLGASYFRAVGQGLNYGITARGLALDTGLPSQEEFPVFREFWVVKPEPTAHQIVVYALLDSERVAGAYRFAITPGGQTVMDVDARLFFRDAVQKLGLAPLTSMFFHGEDTDRFIDDFRPEVHDSDGLLVENGTGERIWRPLSNPVGLRVSEFEAQSPRAFGLFQRDREFANYQDLEANYQNRPSALVEPVGDWGKGVVELVEIPSAAERYDNIVAYWKPQTQPGKGQPLELRYRLRFTRDPEAGLQGGRAIATRIGAGGTDVLDPNKRKFVIEFAGPTLAGLDPETPVEAVVSSSTGQLSKPIAQANPQTRGWRVFFELSPDGAAPADLRAFLRHGDDVLSETWSFRWVRE